MAAGDDSSQAHGSAIWWPGRHLASFVYADRVTERARRRLPIGVQTFRKIRETDAYYVDKTPWIERLVLEGNQYFLSRPRRFGKSLLVDTIKELFEGNGALFEGLAIHDRWDWSKEWPVVRISFGSGSYSEPGQLQAEVEDRLGTIERANGLSRHASTPGGRLAAILRDLHDRTGRRVVVLVDEYDKPILDPLTRGRCVQDGEGGRTAYDNRDLLRGLYSVIKDSDAHIRFSFLTGVSKFSKVSLFSGLNNLIDITLDPRYSSICGYTDFDLDTVFAPELRGLDRDRIRDWYNGYNWLGDEKLYNPFGVLMFFRTRRFASHWFETASPAFLVESLFRRRFASPNLERVLAGDDLLSAFDVEHIGTEALLWQTGYLTIREERIDRLGESNYLLGYPNREVRAGLNRSLLRALAGAPDGAAGTADARVLDLLEARDADGLWRLFHAFFAGIPYEWFTRNDIARFEGYYASVFYSYFTALGVEVKVEESTNRGRLDMAVRFDGQVFLFEFKVVEQAGEGSAMAQLKDRGDADRYRASGEPVLLVGVEFSGRTRNVERIEVEAA